MRGIPSTAQGKQGALHLAQSTAFAAAVAAALRAEQTQKQGAVFWSSKGLKPGSIAEAPEPRSVLGRQRSPSPPSSATSTLSSFLGGGGGGGSSDSAGVAAVSGDKPASKWPLLAPSADPDASGGGGQRKDEWASELPPIPPGLEMGFGGGADKRGLGLEEWEAMLSDSSVYPAQEQTFLRWIISDVDDASTAGGLKQQLLTSGLAELDGGGGNVGLGFALVDPPAFALEPIGGLASSSSISPPPLASDGSSGGGLSFTAASNSSASNLLLRPTMLFPEPVDLKLPLFSPPSRLLSQQQQSHAAPNPDCFFSLPPYAALAEHHPPPPLPHLLPTPSNRHHSIPYDPKLPLLDSPAGIPELFLHPNELQMPQQAACFPLVQPPPFHLQLRPTKPKATAGDPTMAAAAQQQQQQQALLDQLFDAAKMVDAGNSISARGILARLNHQLPTPWGKPLLRSAFYFKEALHLVLANSPNPAVLPSSVVTPFDSVLKLSAYKAFSEVSPILQFANFTCTQALLEELGSPDRIHIIDFDIGVGSHWSSFIQELAQRGSSAALLLKITAFVSSTSQHYLELQLACENLSHFAGNFCIPFEFNILNIECFDPSEILPIGNEAIAVNLPVSSVQNPYFPAILRLVKQLAPKIVVSVDHGCDRSDLPFPQHFLHAFQSCMFLLDSIDSAGTSLDVATKIERFLVQPRIEVAVLGRHRSVYKMLPWRTLFASAGFVPVQFSNFTEMQAECLLKRVQVRGFHVEKRQSSLVLYWQRGELVSVSAWKC